MSVWRRVGPWVSYKITKERNAFKNIVLERDKSFALKPKESASDIFIDLEGKESQEEVYSGSDEDDDVFD